MRRAVLGTVGLWAVGAIVLRVVFVPAEVCTPIAPADAIAAAEAAADWIVRAQHPDGSYVYEYDRDSATALPGYNVVRHAGVTMSLYQLLAAGHRPDLLPAADLGLEWMQGNLYDGGDWLALQDPADGSVRLGASSLMLVSLAHRRIATGDTAHDDLMRALSRYLLVMQEPDGSFLNSWDRATRQPIPGLRSKYATGEAFWGLALMHRFFPAEGWDVPTRAVADYLACCRDDYEDQQFPPWADQWAAYGLAEMAAWAPNPAGTPNLTEEHLEYARRLAERFGFLVRAESQRGDSRFSELIRGRQARAAGTGTWVEALASLWQLASIEPAMDGLRDPLAERAACGAGMLAARQVESAVRSGAAPDLESGAWFTKGVTRMDDQQHALSGLLLASPAIAAREQQ